MEKENLTQNKSEKRMLIKNICWTLISFALSALTIFVVLTETKVFSLKDVFYEIKEGNTVYFIIAIFCMLLFIASEGEAIRCILKKISKPIKHRKGFFYSCADIYFSAITPSASGGQPATLFFMIKDGIPLSVCSICLLLNLFMYNCAIVFIGIICVLFKNSIFINHSVLGKALIIIGFVMLSGLMIFFFLLIKKPDWVKKIGLFLCDLLHKLKLLKNKKILENKIEKTIEKYSIISENILNEKTFMLKIFGFNLFQRCIQISIAVFVYLGIDGSVNNISNVWFAQAFSVIGSNCVPIPGAVGVIDYLMLEGFGQFMDVEMAAHTEIISRATNFYICIIVSLITVLIGYFRSKKNSNYS